MDEGVCLLKVAKVPPLPTTCERYAALPPPIQANQGDCPPSKPRPGMMDQVGRFKHDAWVGLRGMSKDAARSEYCKVVIMCDGGDVPAALAGTTAATKASNEDKEEEEKIVSAPAPAPADTPRRMTDPEATPEVTTPGKVLPTPLPCHLMSKITTCTHSHLRADNHTS